MNKIFKISLLMLLLLGTYSLTNSVSAADCAQEGEKIDLAFEGERCCEGLVAESVCNGEGTCVLSARICRKEVLPGSIGGEGRGTIVGSPVTPDSDGKVIDSTTDAGTIGSGPDGEVINPPTGIRSTTTPMQVRTTSTVIEYNVNKTGSTPGETSTTMIMVKRLEENQAQTREMTTEGEAPTTGDHEPFKGDSDKGTGSNINSFLITEGGTEVKTSNTVTVREARMYMETSTGEEREVKMMPSQVTEVVAGQLNLKNYSIELKNIKEGNTEGEKPVYIVSGKKEVRMFGLFKIEMTTESQINTETGEVEETATPWWSFLTRG